MKKVHTGRFRNSQLHKFIIIDHVFIPTYWLSFTTSKGVIFVSVMKLCLVGKWKHDNCGGFILIFFQHAGASSSMSSSQSQRFVSNL